MQLSHAQGEWWATQTVDPCSVPRVQQSELRAAEDSSSSRWRSSQGRSSLSHLGLRTQSSQRTHIAIAKDLVTFVSGDSRRDVTVLLGTIVRRTDRPCAVLLLAPAWRRFGYLAPWGLLADYLLEPYSTKEPAKEHAKEPANEPAKEPAKQRWGSQRTGGHHPCELGLGLQEHVGHLQAEVPSPDWRTPPAHTDYHPGELEGSTGPVRPFSPRTQSPRKFVSVELLIW